MGSTVENNGVLAFRFGGKLYATGFSGLGKAGKHGTGRQAVDVCGLRRLATAGAMTMVVDVGVSPEARAVLTALAARYGWGKKDAAPWTRTETPPEQIGIGIELGEDGALVCLPVIGGPGRHECPDMRTPLDHVLVGGLQAPFGVFMRGRTAAEREELRAVVEGLRALR